MRALKASIFATGLLIGCVKGLRLTDTFTDASCLDSNNTIIQGFDLQCYQGFTMPGLDRLRPSDSEAIGERFQKGNDGGTEFKCMKEFDSYIESLEYHNYLYYDQSLRKFNDSVATCHADARVKSISWLKDGTELVGQCEDCSELELFIQLFPDEYAFYECHVNETTGDETKLVDIGRFPGHENYTVSWFECCGGVSFIYLHLDLTTVVTDPPPEKPLIPKESAFNMIYGTLVGIALFVVIVILCWMLSTKLERDKQRKKREEQEKNAKESKRQNKESYDDEEPLI